MFEHYIITAHVLIETTQREYKTEDEEDLYANHTYIFVSRWIDR
jgi:hypothetical protein